MESKGTASIEFLFTIMVMLFMCSGLVCVVSERLDTVNDTAELSEARLLLKTVSSNINNVYAAGDGQSKEITLPPSVGDSDYRLIANSSGLYIKFSGMIGKADLYPMVLVNGHSNNSHFVEMLPGKTYCIKNTAVGNESWIFIYSN